MALLRETILPMSPYYAYLQVGRGDYDRDDGKGDEFVRRARATFAGRIVAISSHQRGNDALRAAGADACCSKMDFDRINELLLQRPA